MSDLTLFGARYAASGQAFIRRRQQLIGLRLGKLRIKAGLNGLRRLGRNLLADQQSNQALQPILATAQRRCAVFFESLRHAFILLRKKY